MRGQLPNSETQEDSSFEDIQGIIFANLVHFNTNFKNHFIYHALQLYLMMFPKMQQMILLMLKVR